MPSTLVFPDGVRFPHLDELPGPEPDRARAWLKIQSASIVAGFVLSKSTDPRFAFYAEANVDAPKIWEVFRDLCQSLFGPVATLVISEIDDEPLPAGPAVTLEVLRLLQPHKYQLAHDGWIQFGLIHQEDDLLSEVFVAPTKHFTLWLNDEKLFRSTMQYHAISEVESLEFIDEYPRTTTRLASDRVVFQDHSELIEHIRRQIAPK
jgi:hypothetical protein